MSFPIVLSLVAATTTSQPYCGAPFSFGACEGATYEAADRDLNIQWRKTFDEAHALDFENSTKDGGPKGKPEKSAEGLLIKAQRAWLIYRKANCDIVYNADVGGTMGSIDYFGCMTRMTKLRIEELKNIMITGS